MQPAVIYQEEWVKILSKGLITIPKSFRDELGLKEGEIAKVKKIGKRLVIEPREIPKKQADLSTLSSLKIKGGPKDLSKNLDRYLYQ